NVNTPPKNDIFRNVKRSIQNTEQQKSEIDRQILNIPHQRMLTGFIVQVNRAMDQAAANAEKLTETTMQVTEEDLERPPADKYEGSSIPVYIQQQYEHALAVTNNIRKNFIPPAPPEPPSKDHDYCFPCDARRRDAYRRDSASFMEYFKDERTAMKEAFAVLGYFYYRKVKKFPYDTARAWKMEIDMNEALPVLFRHIGRKLKLAWETYNNDAAKIEFLAEACINYIRDEQLTGFSMFPGFPELPEVVGTVIKRTREAFQKARNERNYKVLLNISWYAGLMRMPDLYGMENISFIESLEQFMNITNFDVVVDAHARLKKDAATMYATMHGECVFTAVPDSNCLLKWTMIDPDSTLMYFELEDQGLQVENKTAHYTGTRYWKSYSPDFRLDFCRDDKDTAFLFGYLPYKGQETWEIGGKVILTAVINSTFTMGFMDIKRLQAIASDPDMQAKMKEEMMAKYNELKKNMPANTDPSKMTPQELEQLNRAINSAREMKNIIHPALPTSFLCGGHLVNGSKIVFNSTLNGKELFPQNTAIQEAILTLKIEHKAN
ncbi:MAG TPA: hypothetical protein VEB42_05255, partial [Chitinophagaceae bacterium]|nr:hypothetical protein [Chitinophagaceae bacterium]